MTAKNLAAIFQPSMISHPEHDMNPKEYELSRIVLEFLVNFSYKLLPNVFEIPKEKLQKNVLRENEITNRMNGPPNLNTGRRHSKSLSITMNDRDNMELLRVVNKTESDLGEDDLSNHFEFEASPKIDQISVLSYRFSNLFLVKCLILIPQFQKITQKVLMLVLHTEKL